MAARALRALLAAALALFAAGVLAQGVLYDRSEIRFVSKQMGAAAEGRFRKWRADIDFRPAEPGKSRADFDIDLASIDLASEDAEKEVRRREWFDTERFAVATFRSTSIRELGGERYEVVGTLTLKGTGREVIIPVQVRKDGAGNSVAEGQFTIRRGTFGIGEGPWADPTLVADDVLVRVRIVLGRAG